MEKFVSSWCDGKTLPEKYILPPAKQPVELSARKSNLTLPVVDLGKADGEDRASVIRQIIEACQELGAFQVINHGVTRKMMDDARSMFKQFFNLPAEEKSRFISWNASDKFAFYTSNYSYHEEEFHFWRDVVTQKCSPMEECVPHWPDKPDSYREIIGEYTTQATDLGARLLDLIAEGLGLEAGHFANELSQDVEMNINHYPPCPDPSVAWGVGMHSDRSLITILLQGDVPGLQIVKDGECIDADPIPDAFVVNLGRTMEIASNGKLRSGDHQALTDQHEARESAALFLCPTRDCLIEPAKAIVDAGDCPLYRGVRYHEFLKSHNAVRRLKITPDNVLKPFLITS